jgi:uncharacterized coiled-coil protein SlyX
MNKEVLEARIAELKSQMATVHANYNALNGAVQDCEYWLSQLNPVLDTPVKEETK